MNIKTSKRKKQKRMTKKKNQNKLAGNYTSIKGDFELSTDIKSQHRKGPFVFGDHQWGRLTNWIASETLIKPTFDMDELIQHMSNKDISIAMKAKREFNRKVSRAIIMGEGDRQYMLGETLSKFPKIKKGTYRTMKLCDLVKILMDYRSKIMNWKQELEAKQTKKNTRQAAENTSPKAAENTSPKIKNTGNLNNWENLVN
mgnify:FL=1|tara:strand:+ start:2031 stop:2630 length:600 start_codon:yes stop_codon:yes gene_type:complete